jgi:hypothetical protein
MHMCRLYPVHSAKPHEFEWEWRCERRSPKTFAFFHDCMDDARRKGFRVVLDNRVGESTPARHSVLEY